MAGVECDGEAAVWGSVPVRDGDQRSREGTRSSYNTCHQSSDRARADREAAAREASRRSISVGRRAGARSPLAPGAKPAEHPDAAGQPVEEAAILTPVTVSEPVSPLLPQTGLTGKSRNKSDGDAAMRGASPSGISAAGRYQTVQIWAYGFMGCWSAFF